DGVQMPINREIWRGAELQIGVAKQREPARKSGFRGFDDRVAFGGEALVHHIYNRFSLFERGAETPGLRPQVVTQHVCRALAASIAPDRVEFVEQLFVVHLRGAPGPQAVTQFGDPLTGANLQLVKTHSLNFAELFNLDRHNSSLSVNSPRQRGQS